MVKIRKKKLKLLGIFVCVICFCFGLTALSANASDDSDKNNELTLLLNEAADIAEVESVLYEMNPSFSITSLEEIKLINIKSEEYINEKEIMSNQVIRTATSDYGNLADIEQEGIALTDVCTDSAAVSLENTEIESDADDIELLYSLAWHIDDVTDSKKALDIAAGEGVEIALVDSGVDYLHPLLADKINLTDAKSYISEDATLNDTNGHGTMVSGVIAQIAPDAEITPYRVIGESSGDSLWTIEAIVQATNDGKDVINMSLGTYKNVGDGSENLTVKAFERAADFALSKGVVMVSSAGNKGLNLDSTYQEDLIRHLPGSLEGVIAVSSTTRDREFASYSNYGSNVQFAAPGGDYLLVDGMYDLSQWIYTAYPSSMDNGLSILGIPQGYMFSVGTSLSAPAMTAGIASFMTHYQKMTGESASRDTVMSYFKNSALDLGTSGYDTYFGNGKMDIYEALSAVEDKIAPDGEMISATVEINTEVSVEDFIINISDNKDSQEDIKVYFETAYGFDALGEKEVVVVLEDTSNNKTFLSGSITVVDTIPPTGNAKKAVIEQGEVLEAGQLVTDIQDNAGADQVELELVTDVDTKEVGTYPVTVSLKDQSGNEAFVESEVEVKALLTQTDVVDAKNTLAPSGASDISSIALKAATPKTGDESEINLLIGAMFGCVLVIGCIVYERKKRG